MRSDLSHNDFCHCSGGFHNIHSARQTYPVRAYFALCRGYGCARSGVYTYSGSLVKSHGDVSVSTAYAHFAAVLRSVYAVG